MNMTRKEEENANTVNAKRIASIYPFIKVGMEQELSYIMSDLLDAPYYDKNASYVDQGASLSIPTNVCTDAEQLSEFKNTIAETENEAKLEMGENSSMYKNVVKRKAERLLNATNVLLQVLEEEGVKNFEDVGLSKDLILAREFNESIVQMEEEKSFF